jgi:hypothetical protein
VERTTVALGRFCFKLALCLCSALCAFGQQTFNASEIPPNFNVDLETAARLRPGFTARSMAATGRYAIGSLVFARLVEQAPKPVPSKFAWELRIVNDGQLNAYSSPDGAIYIESGLADLAGQSAGLWAAILSHEIAHVVHRDWARRYLYEKSLESDSAVINLGDPGLPSASWTDSRKASADLARFCRELEIAADRDGLILMARAGYHPDFVPALHHLLHAHSSPTPASLYAMHPCWEERDRELLSAYVAASIEFEHRWPDWHASPGGNPPVVVFTDAPTVRMNSAKEREIQVPMRCENLAGAIEVVLHLESRRRSVAARLKDLSNPDSEMRQLTGCTSPRTMVTFTLTDSSDESKRTATWADVYVLDASGAILARADVPKLPH